MNVSVCAFAFLSGSHGTVHDLAKNSAKTWISGTVHDPRYYLLLKKYFAIVFLAISFQFSAKYAVSKQTLFQQ